MTIFCSAQRGGTIGVLPACKRAASRCELCSSYNDTMTKNCSVEPAALYKILLHSLKHTAGVNGVLLGTVSVGTATGAGPATAVRVVDAVPVGHGFVTLTPVLEMALSQVG